MLDARQFGQVASQRLIGVMKHLGPRHPLATDRIHGDAMGEPGRQDDTGLRSEDQFGLHEVLCGSNDNVTQLFTDFNKWWATLIEPVVTSSTPRYRRRVNSGTLPTTIPVGAFTVKCGCCNQESIFWNAETASCFWSDRLDTDGTAALRDGLRMNRCQTLPCNFGFRMAYSTLIRAEIFSHGNSTLTGESAFRYAVPRAASPVQELNRRQGDGVSLKVSKYRPACITLSDAITVSRRRPPRYGPPAPSYRCFLKGHLTSDGACRPGGRPAPRSRADERSFIPLWTSSAADAAQPRYHRPLHFRPVRTA